ncbi:MAG: NAD-dependent epimerase/dehydratase family protein, partial [Myxococcota bacterium]|nr:NAD-dependent epimerase/dehydratase family protein [Myxococcota bacterium]
MKKALVCGAGGFIGSHLAKRLKQEGFWVRGIDLKEPEFSSTQADEFLLGDLRHPDFCKKIFDQQFDEVYQLAADMGGAGYIFTGENDAHIMHNSALINLNVAKSCAEGQIKKVFYASSACIYPGYNQTEPNNPKCTENSVYPAEPDSEYGWEKLFSERIYLAFQRNYALNIRIARLHNVFGPEGVWTEGREKVPAAFCRKVAQAPEGGELEIWGDGTQTRSFLFIDECIEGIRRLMGSEFDGVINLGSEEMVSINELARMVMKIAGKTLMLKHIDGPLGVKGRTSDNTLIRHKLNWAPTAPLVEGLSKTYPWIAEQVALTKQ